MLKDQLHHLLYLTQYCIVLVPLLCIHNSGRVLWQLRSTEHTKRPMKTPGESNIRQHTVCDNNRKEGIKVIGPSKKHRNTLPNQETGLYNTTGTV